MTKKKAARGRAAKPKGAVRGLGGERDSEPGFERGPNRARRRNQGSGTRAARPTTGRKLPLWGTAVLLVQLGLMLTVFNPSAHNGGDTAGYVTLAHSLLERGTYTDLWHPTEPPHTKYPPVFPLLLAGAIGLGARTWAALKVVPALFTTLSVLAIYLWARDRRDAPFGAAVALLTAGSSALLWSSHWELSEPPFMAFTFLSLWAYDRMSGSGGLPRLGGLRDEAAGQPTTSTPPEERTNAAITVRSLALGGVFAGLAYFTRSAGLPLMVAAGTWLLLGRRRRAAVALICAVGLPALLWSLRGGQGTQYVSEFWMVDPYQPDLGRVGLGGLMLRVIQNAVGYATVHVPTGILGTRGALTAVMGVALFGLAAWGWGRRLRARPGVAEVFAPLYLGLILVWPEVWSGDRFALPLIPLLLFYAGELLVGLTAVRTPPARRVVLAVAIAVVALPALISWKRELRVASGCSALVRSEGGFACWGSRTQEFVQAAAWSRANLPNGVVVLSRKPRIFYVMSGVTSEVFPFTRDADRFLRAADSLGARYVIMDHLDAAASVYVGETLYRRGGAFCGLAGFGGEASGMPPTQMFGILPPELRATAEARDAGGGTVSIMLEACPADMTRPDPLAVPPVQSERIPLLAGFL